MYRSEKTGFTVIKDYNNNSHSVQRSAALGGVVELIVDVLSPPESSTVADLFPCDCPDSARTHRTETSNQNPPQLKVKIDTPLKQGCDG